MENVERILKQSDQQSRSFPVEEHRWESLQQALQTRKRRRKIRYWSKHLIPLLLLLFLIIGVGSYFRSEGSQTTSVEIGEVEEPATKLREPTQIQALKNANNPADQLNDAMSAALENTPAEAKDAAPNSVPVPLSKVTPQIRRNEPSNSAPISPPSKPTTLNKGIITFPKGISENQDTAQTFYQYTPDFVDGPDGLPGLIKDVADSNVQPVPYFSRENQMLLSITYLPELQKLPFASKNRALPAEIPDPLEASPPLFRKWVIGVSTGLIKGLTTLSPARYLEEQSYSGQLISKKIAGIDLYQMDEMSSPYSDYGRSISIQLQCYLSGRLSIAIGLDNWRYQYEGRSLPGENQPSHVYTQRISMEQTHWLSGVGLQYRLLDLGRWQFQVGSYTMFSLSNKSRSHLEYWRDQQLIGAETLIENTPWEHSMRIRMDGQLLYRLHPNWQIGLGSGFLLDKPLLPYFDLRFQVRL